jgi:hypothetical protein
MIQKRQCDNANRVKSVEKHRFVERKCRIELSVNARNSDTW